MRDPNATWGSGWRAFRRSRVLIFLPFTLSFIAGLISNARRQPAPTWLPLVQKAAGTVAGLYLLYPFWFRKIVMRNPAPLRARGKDPEETILLVTTTCSVLPAMLAFFLCLAGGPAKHVYYASVVSVVAAFYWAWRYRHLYSELRM